MLTVTRVTITSTSHNFGLHRTNEILKIFKVEGRDEIFAVSDKLDIFCQACLTINAACKNSKNGAQDCEKVKVSVVFLLLYIFVIRMCHNKVCFCFCSATLIRHVWAPEPRVGVTGCTM